MTLGAKFFRKCLASMKIQTNSQVAVLRGKTKNYDRGRSQKNSRLTVMQPTRDFSEIGGIRPR